jgi:cation diffusion facilitator CzcD-associated flavoprotein CzcO
MPTSPNTTARHPLRVIVIGAGLSGIMAAIKLREAGHQDVVIYEKAARPGGTWRDNTYPGIACDIPSHFYSYSFAPNPSWSRRYASGDEILRYVEDVMRRFDVERLIRFGAEITRCAWEHGRWQLTTRDQQRDAADVVIAATGVLHQPVEPKLPGLDSFAGARFHSARWDHQIALDGRRIGVIGTGSSAVQIVSALAPRAGRLSLFQRTAQWIMPQDNAAYSEEELARFRADPVALRGLREKLQKRFTAAVSNAFVDVSSPEYAAVEAACLTNLETQVTDPVLRERLRPSYRAACKRLVVSQDFYQAVQRPNVELVTGGIERIEPEGVRTRDGQLHPLDVLVLATGFAIDRFMRPIAITGHEGLALNQVWDPDPFAYLMVTVPGFPNLFMLNGPSSPVGNYPLIEVAEQQMAYALRLIEPLRQGACRAIMPTRAATERYEQERIAAAKRTVWASGCNSYYLDAQQVPVAWPWSIERFYAEMAEPKLSDFALS